MCEIETKCPCKGCNDRKVGCHEQCEKYKSWRHELTKLRITERLNKYHGKLSASMRKK